MVRILYLLLLALATQLSAQKMVHIPLYLQNPNDVNGAQFTWSKTAQSTNFILIWGNTVGTNPANYPDPNLAFDPAKILDTMEYIYSEFKELEFLDDSPGTNLAQYKIPIVIYGTWGPNGAQGWANGGDADGVIGAFWVHPNAMHDGGVAAHEFAHSMQAQNNIDYRATNGLGYSWQNAGIFWECHANFMRNLLYPQAVTAWGMDVYHLETWGDWKNTYENYAMLFAIMEMEGIDMVNRLWRESYSNEYPLQAYKRLAGYSQAQFNDSLFHYARRMATYDFSYNNVGSFFRQYRNADLNNWLPTVQNCYSILRQVPGGDPGRYEIPIEQAPEEFAYNIIPLYPNADSCSVIVKFKGHTEANTHTGWRYGFVVANANGTVSRYSPTYSANTDEIAFHLQGNETKMFLVVMGAPNDGITTNTSNDTWHGYPKHFRFPYEVNISGAVPEGYQPAANFRTPFRTNGHLHSNGGGWVKNSATVASSVYVGPTAMVLGNANISGTVRIEGTSIVRNATMSGNVRILGNAVVDGGNYSQNAKVQGNAFVVNATMSGSALVGMRARVDNYNLSGTIEVGGDVVVYNDQGNCNNGVYYRLTNYYDNKLLECDGRTASHPANSDVNNTYNAFNNAEMEPQCQCAGVDEVVVDSMDIAKPTCTNLSSGGVQFHISSSCGPFTYAWNNGNETGTNLDGLSPGNYSFTITDALDREGVVSVMIPSPPTLTGAITALPYNCVSTLGGSIGVNIVGGTLPFSYAWSSGQTVAAFTNVLPGSYSVTVTDGLGCTFTASSDIGLVGQLIGNIVGTPALCNDPFGGSLNLTVSNGTFPFDYEWDNGAPTEDLILLPPGDYCVTVTDDIGCTLTLCETVDLVGELLPSFASTPASCGDNTGGSLSVALNGGTAPFEIEWSNGATTATVNDLLPGTYSITATDAFGCSFMGLAEVGISGQLNATLTATLISCNASTGGAVSVSVNSGTAPFEFEWSNGATTAVVNDLTADTYFVTVTDTFGCSFTGSTDVEVSGQLGLNLSTNPVSCFGNADGSATVSPQGGTAPFIWLWEDGQMDSLRINLIAGDYAVTVSDASGCVGSLQFTLTEPDSLSLQIAQANTACFGGSDGGASVAISGGTPDYIYLWANGSTSPEADSLVAGDYAVTVSDAHGCSATAMTTITSPPILTVETLLQNASCFGVGDGVATAIANGGTPSYTYTWSNGMTDSTIANLVVGSYTVTIMDANGCTETAGFPVTSPSALELVFEAPAVLCPNATGEITAMVIGGTSPFSYQWNTGEMDSVLVAIAGAYTLLVSDANGCTQFQPVLVQEAAPVLLTAADVTPASTATTADGAISIDFLGGAPPFTFLWSNGDTELNLVNLLPGDYTLTITDGVGCEWVYAFTVGFDVSATFNPQLNIKALIAPNPSYSHAALLLDLPQGQAMTVTVADVLGRNLLNEKTLFRAGINSFTLPLGLAAGVYWVMVQDADGRTKVMRWVVQN
ncbi:MAG: T9SS type A sorting domain-containing protein [Bacteroidetes bacterium]|nr:T9SS type A sorting domain-containing protein [Bacteroidota bacterium]